MQKRERLFFGVSSLTAWRVAGINILNIMYKLPGHALHGHLLKQMLFDLFGNVWTPGNNLLYDILNEYEDQGYLVSYWQAGNGQKKRNIRFYKLTEEGVRYLASLKGTFMDDLDLMQRILERALDLTWGDRERQEEIEEPNKVLSSTVFSLINILRYLDKNTKVEEPLLYGQQIASGLSREYSNMWEPSDGSLYTTLSQLEEDGYAVSSWHYESTGIDQKKRTVRQFAITDKGKEYYSKLKQPESGIKNRLLQLIDLCQANKRLVYGTSAEMIKETRQQIVGD